MSAENKLPNPSNDSEKGASKIVGAAEGGGDILSLDKEMDELMQKETEYAMQAEALLREAETLPKDEGNEKIREAKGLITKLCELAEQQRVVFDKLTEKFKALS
ncbi:MAG: hypothetical protein UR31_C0025G0008 [Parcubacteria group bacterium GW2011_GWA2_33_14]|uniref:Uncharacterized protein n=1 Tax=Candidatus Staskawiczbacteria bacterium RIFCSPHIGHO2_02_FULL_33_16 TaxID=1802204 RepID=A0A1G2HXG7_9BACT|nr:MAG: hypothetical protein UR31_C0025G0008 [Parcubacteria group bacterium GW2011_GWA2_33_14]OGZ67244.1 MAG: hypothetical protein A3D34_00465 [Candidatus Staskawiczbacteria bacterium RIFCSPHIGHO2_02_FULL_33_16]OGZ70908.1 MAG: hypothetical protein A2980_02720 [Candidatus Staskawiczbacteria bacterium RIFCSPLOWO2_01_FULL_33_13]